MSSEIFKKLINEICVIAKMSRAEASSVTVNLMVDGVHFALVDASGDGADALAFYCDFGLPPERNRAAVLDRLLKVNLSLHGLHMPIFAINPETGHVLLARRIPLKGLSALELMNMLAECAVSAKEWRRTYFLVHRALPGKASLSFRKTWSELRIP